MVAANIAEQERAEWSAEARSLRQVAARRRQGTIDESLAEKATERMLEGAAGSVVGK